jgi:DNA-binding MarR family transcriptional regulator/GNAT superfamily N-acetyltransferase
MRDAVPRLRAFNRFMGRELGFAHEHFLGRGRPYGQSRLLYEIGVRGATVRELRLRLRLDSGYLSRMLRALEGEGLVSVEPYHADRRTRVALLTRAGKAELRSLDQASNRVAHSWLAGLDPAQSVRLLRSIAEVQHLLLCARVRIGLADPASAAARDCLRQYYGELDRRFDGGFRPGVEAGSELAAYRRPHGRFYLARLPSGEVVGCAGLRLLGDGLGEIKRMWVAPQARGAGVGRQLLLAVEQGAARQRLRVLRLDTHSSLREAIALYVAAGYRAIRRYNDNAYAQRWFEKRLAAKA